MGNFSNTDQMKKIISTLEKYDFVLSVDHGDDKARHSKKTRPFTFYFVFHYEKGMKNYQGATYENPNECDFVFEITKISDLYVYNGKEQLIDLEEKDLELITSLIEDKIVGNTIID